MQVLDYSDSHFGDAEAIQLCDVLKYTTRLGSLNLQRNDISDAGVVAIGKWLRATPSPVRTLALIQNKFGVRGSAALAGAITHNDSLEGLSLYLGFNSLGEEGIGALREAQRCRPTVTVKFH